MAVAGLTGEQLRAGLHAAGLEAGDSVIVHSSYRALGPVEGGPAAVLDALLAVLGPDGNLMLPTFNYTRPLPEPYFDPATTPGRTGILTELGRQRPGAVRSLHPTHSVAVLGPAAVELTAGHLECRAFGVGSPIDRLAQAGGKVLLLGVGHISNSTVHVAEEYAGVPKVSWYDPPPAIKVLLPDGQVTSIILDTSPSCSSAFEAAAHPLRAAGCIQDSRLGTAKLQVMRGRDVTHHVAAAIRTQPDVLLCTASTCAPCRGARAALAARNS